MNAILLNDLRKSIFRRKPVHAIFYGALCMAILTRGLFYLMPDAGTYRNNLIPVFRFPDILLPIIAPAFAAGAFAKEHEQRTWQDILLTRMSAGEILWGKFLSSALPTLLAIIVLFPPFLLLLIIMGMDPALQPGAWMLEVGFKAVVGLLFYITVAMVCSYHSPNARAALVIGYCTLAGFAMLNFLFYRLVIEPLLLPPGYSYYDFSGNGYNGNNGYFMYRSRMSYSLTGVDWIVILEAGLIAVGLLVHLLVRIRDRRA